MPDDVGKVETPIWDTYKEIVKKHDSTFEYAFGASDHRICKIEKRGKESMPGTDETCSDGIFYFNYADFCRSIDLYGGDKDDASE